jgi:hypothetical protein
LPVAVAVVKTLAVVPVQEELLQVLHKLLLEQQ